MPRSWLLAALAVSVQGCMVTNAAHDALMPDGPRAVTGLVDCAAVDDHGAPTLTLLFRLRSGETVRVVAPIEHDAHLARGPVTREERLPTRGMGCISATTYGPEPAALPASGVYFPPDGGPPRDVRLDDQGLGIGVLVVLSEDDDMTARVPGSARVKVGALPLDRHDRPVLGTIAFVIIVPVTVAVDIVGFPIEAIVMMSKIMKND